MIARVSATVALPREEGGGWLPDGSRMTWLNAPSGKKQDRLPVRAAEHNVIMASGDGKEEVSETCTVITTLLDHEAAPADAVRDTYLTRWSASETTFGRAKTTITEAGNRTSGPVLRSGSPRLVIQEAWAWLTATQLVRASEAAALRSEAALGAGLDAHANPRAARAVEQSKNAIRGPLWPQLAEHRQTHPPPVDRDERFQPRQIGDEVGVEKPDQLQAPAVAHGQDVVAQGFGIAGAQERAEGAVALVELAIETVGTAERAAAGGEKGLVRLFAIARICVVEKIESRGWQRIQVAHGRARGPALDGPLPALAADPPAVGNRRKTRWTSCKNSGKDSSPSPMHTPSSGA